MRLAFKLTIFIMIIMAVLLVIHGTLVVEREIDLFKQNMELHANLVGDIVIASLPDILQSNDIDRLEEFIENVNLSEKRLQVYLVHFDSSAADLRQPRINIKDISRLLQGKEIMTEGIDYDGDQALFAYFPIPRQFGHLMAIEVSESLTPMKDYIKNTIYRKVILFLAMVVFGSLLVLWLGARMVGQPVSEMAGLAGRVSEGDFSGSVPTHNKRDELAYLASGLNEMVEKLDISRKRLEEETAKKLETIEQLHHSERLATVGKLASGLAHELGTPLNVVSGRARMISSGDMNDDEIRECAEIIDEQSVRMTKILRQLLDFARRRTPEKIPSDIKETIEGAVTLLRPTASSKKIDLKVETIGEFPSLKIDPGQIQQVLSNMVMNAVHAMPDGGDITISVEKSEATPPPELNTSQREFIRIRVTDQGLGIPEKDINRIFTPFFSTKGVGEGTGLGLSISHGIISEHGGWIDVTSQLGKGSEFSIFLPTENDK